VEGRTIENQQLECCSGVLLASTGSSQPGLGVVPEVLNGSLGLFVARDVLEEDATQPLAVGQEVERGAGGAANIRFDVQVREIDAPITNLQEEVHEDGGGFEAELLVIHDR